MGAVIRGNDSCSGGLPLSEWSNPAGFKGRKCLERVLWKGGVCDWKEIGVKWDGRVSTDRESQALGDGKFKSEEKKGNSLVVWKTYKYRDSVLSIRGWKV